MAKRSILITLKDGTQLEVAGKFSPHFGGNTPIDPTDTMLAVLHHAEVAGAVVDVRVVIPT